MPRDCPSCVRPGRVLLRCRSLDQCNGRCYCSATTYGYTSDSIDSWSDDKLGSTSSKEASRSVSSCSWSTASTGGSAGGLPSLTVSISLGRAVVYARRDEADFPTDPLVLGSLQPVPVAGYERCLPSFD
jgi:hypothetical protein